MPARRPRSRRRSGPLEAEIARLEAKIQRAPDQQRAQPRATTRQTSRWRRTSWPASRTPLGATERPRRGSAAVRRDPHRLALPPGGEDLAWSCNALLPLSTGGHARLPLTGTIRNVRTRTGKSLATTETVVRYVFEEGRDLSRVPICYRSAARRCSIKRVMPWLVADGVTARGAKCALVDHPLPEVRRELHAWATRGPDTPTPPVTSAYTQRLRATYFDPDLAWGDAAVPDDTTWIAAALRLLTPDTETRRQGLPVLDVALAVGRSEAEVRELVKPQKRVRRVHASPLPGLRQHGQDPREGDRLPHGRCKGRRFADHVVLLPEVAASGYGVICSHCRRTPATHDAWPSTQFPTTYLGSWTTNSSGGSLRHEAQTVPTQGRRDEAPPRTGRRTRTVPTSQ